MAYYPEPVARLIDALQRLPGIGPKTAQRLTFYMLKRPTDEVRELGDALIAVKEKITYCRTCFNVTDAIRRWIKGVDRFSVQTGEAGGTGPSAHPVVQAAIAEFQGEVVAVRPRSVEGGGQ